MQMTDRSKALLEIFRQGLSHSGLVQTNINLGDRQSYLGVSDIAQYLECPRVAIASKLYPIQDDISSQLILQRGHWFEKGVGNSLASLGLNILPQLEILATSQNAPIKAHLDFTLLWNKPELAVRVLEVKSMNQLPDSPHTRHEMQISAQVALLRKCWNSPVFGIRDGKGAISEHLTFPELCKRHFALSFPDTVENVSIEGWLLYLSMKDAMAFGPYGEDLSILDSVSQAGENFWNEFQALQNSKRTLNDVAYAQGFYPLCEFCHVNSDCPKFTCGNFQPQWENSIIQLEELKKQRARIDESIKKLENSLKQSGSFSHDWISTGAHRFRLSQVKARRSLNRELLLTNLSELFNSMGIGRISPEEFIVSCEIEGSPSSRLMIQTIN